MEGLTLKLKLQYFGHLMRRTDSLEKTLMLGKFEGRRKRGWERMRWLGGITASMDMSFNKPQELSDRQGNLACCSPWGLKALDTTERLNWTELKTYFGHFGPCVFSRLITISEELGLFALEGIRNKWLPFDTPKPYLFWWIAVAESKGWEGEQKLVNDHCKSFGDISLKHHF